MQIETESDRRRLEALGAAALERLQLSRLNTMLDAVLPANAFLGERLAGLKRPVESIDALADVPFTFKADLLEAHQGHDRAHFLTYPPERYVRFHQTSGSKGRPLPVYDTADDWQWWANCWQYTLDAANITTADRALAAFSFGPFIGYWSAWDALAARGTMVIPGGGASSKARLDLIARTGTTALFCTPSYALHLADVAEHEQIDVADSTVRAIVVAGEPGGSLPAVRERIESAWNAVVYDHAGASEVGAWGFPDVERRGVHVIESEFIPEFLSVETGRPADEGELAELVLTNLGRYGSPVVRYRTGDLVRPSWRGGGANRFVLLDGGVLGRTDDMMIIRGVNVYPTAVEQILRSFPEVVEYRMTALKEAEMDQLAIEVEDRLDAPQRVADELRLRLGLRIGVTCVPVGSLPRFEGKGRRFVDSR
ncbi:MAG: phenylacetate--CoA ligase family protein [Planctomycetales bacterium]|nr:phenylacetate--CoA ligase family protein [Planctomycetales bacterium]